MFGIVAVMAAVKTQRLQMRLELVPTTPLTKLLVLAPIVMQLLLEAMVVVQLIIIYRHIWALTFGKGLRKELSEKCRLTTIALAQAATLLARITINGEPMKAP